MAEVGNWTLSYDRGTGDRLLMLEFADRPPINLLIHRDDALGIANAILRNETDLALKRD
jgi:hypothetical protein